MTTLATFRSRIRAMLIDASGTIYADATVDEALRQALAEYNNALPLERETVLILPGDGREIALNGIADLRAVTDVYWPFDSLYEPWPPNQVKGFYVFWDDTQPVLYLNQIDGDGPQQDDELRLWYATNHTIDGLDSATETTIPKEHTSLLVAGAAGHAALMRTVDLTEVSSADQYMTGLLGVWAQRVLKEFRAALEAIKRWKARAGAPYTQGWKLDKWDD